MAKTFFIRVQTGLKKITKQVTGEITIGREVGDIVVADESVSPRHCSLILKDGVVTITDYKSQTGTYIGNHKINPNEPVLLQDKEHLRIGNLEAEFYVELSADEDTPPPVSDEIVKSSPGHNKGRTALLNLSPDVMDELQKESEENSKEYEVKNKLRGREGQRKRLVADDTEATGINAALRTLAVVCDFLVAYIFHVLLSPYESYSGMSQGFAKLIASVMNAVGLSEKSLAVFGDLTVVYSVIFLFVLVRLLSSLCFGVTLSQLFLGFRSYHLWWQSRLLGVVRQIIGFFTGPLFIFDASALFSKRTFKELITMSEIGLRTKFISGIGIFVYFPALIILAIASPMFQGFSASDPIPVKVISLPKKAANISKGSGSFFFQSKLNWEGGRNTITFPHFQVTQTKGKKRINPSVNFFFNDTDATVNFFKYKTFSYYKLLKIVADQDPLFENTFPLINEYVRDVSRVNKNFKSKKWGIAKQKSFEDEMSRLFESCFALDPMKLAEFISSKGPFVKGCLVLKNTVLELIGNSAISQATIIKTNSATSLRLSSKDDSKDYIIPFYRHQGTIFNLEVLTGDYAEAKKAFYQRVLSHSNWQQVQDNSVKSNILATKEEDLFDTFQVMDYFLLKDMTPQERRRLNQYIFAYYYETGNKIMTFEKKAPIEKYLSSTQSLLSLLKVLDKNQKPDEVLGVTVYQKLIRNLTDITHALENRDMTFFGIEQTKTI